MYKLFQILTVMLFLTLSACSEEGGDDNTAFNDAGQSNQNQPGHQANYRACTPDEVDSYKELLWAADNFSPPNRLRLDTEGCNYIPNELQSLVSTKFYRDICNEFSQKIRSQIACISHHNFSPEEIKLRRLRDVCRGVTGRYNNGYLNQWYKRFEQCEVDYESYLIDTTAENQGNF
ncbi:MAG: hypothetical protein AB8E15_12810 [Bdellovibrionales bacterium]